MPFFTLRKEEGEEYMYLIKKVLNVNVIIVEKDNKDVIAFGKGIGYRQKKGQLISEEKISKFYLPIEDNRMESLITFMNNVPVKYIELAYEVIQEAEKYLDTELSANTLFSLTDHIYFTVERIRDNVIMTSSMYWEFKRFYPEEFQAAQKGVAIIEKALGISLNEQEAANITFHIINGNSRSAIHANAIQITKIVTNILKSVQMLVKKKLDSHSLHYERLVTHAKFFAERYLTNTMLNNDAVLIKTVSTLYQEPMSYSQRIKRTLEEIYEKPITEEEIAYLAIHINRLLLSQNEE